MKLVSFDRALRDKCIVTNIMVIFDIFGSHHNDFMQQNNMFEDRHNPDIVVR